MDMLDKNIKTVFENIEKAAVRSGRKPEDIIMVAATKTVPADRINEAIAAGVGNIGENRVQEFTDKFEDIKGDVVHHFIGHLQTNKVKYLVPHISLIHSVESEKLLDEIDRLSKKHGVVTNVLLEINASGEDTKFGIEFDEADEIIKNNENRENCRIKGLMTIGPNYSTEEEIRAAFKKMKMLFDELSLKDYKNCEMKYLSMGMSGDYEIAIEEGANIVRVGSAIFGARNYT